DRLSILDVEGVSAGRATFRHQHTVRAALRHLKGGGYSVRGVLNVCGWRLGNPSRRIVCEIGASRNQTRPQAWVAALRESVIERKNAVFLCLRPEITLQFF